MLVKICGVSDPLLARMVLRAGADLIGIVLTPTSRRFISIEKAKPIVAAIRAENSKPVLVFRHESFKFISAIVSELGDCVVQFQGGMHRDIKNFITTFETIVAFSAEEFSQITYKTRAMFAKGYDEKKTILMIDSQQPGSGKTFCWEALPPPDFPWFLAGGLRSENVCQAIRQLKPAGVDVSTGVENSCAEKDLEKIQAFIQAAKREI